MKQSMDEQDIAEFKRLIEEERQRAITRGMGSAEPNIA
jgi:hypothetical protein